MPKVTSRIIILIIFISTFLLGACSSYIKVDQQQFNTSVQPTAIVNVNILSENGDEMLNNKTVLIRNGKIVDICDATLLDDNVLVIDGSGKFLIPGLVESHTHLKNSPNDLLTFLANGVTYVREMSGNKDHLKWRDEISEGRLGPKMYVASSKVESRPGIFGYFESKVRGRLNINDKDDAKSFIQKIQNTG